MTTGIVGAGISGLTLAYELQRNGQDYHLWEATDQPGGYIKSVRDISPAGAGYLRELGPNSLLGDEDLLGWLDGLGLTPDLVFANDVSKSRFIFRDGTYRELPGTPSALLLGPFFSWKTKWKVFRELSNKTTSPKGETLGQFFRRRFSAEIVDFALGPFVAGIYAGDPERLLVSETFPVLLQYEREYGSVLRGLIKNQGKTARRQSFSFREGMQMLPNALAARLTQLHLNSPVLHLERTGEGWTVHTATGSQFVDRLVLAVSTDAAAHLLEGYFPDFSAALQQIEYPPMVAVHTAYKRADVAHPLNGFGGLNPAVEDRFAAGHIWSSSIFPGRCPADEVLFTTFVGGAQPQRAASARLSEAQIRVRVHGELTESFGIRATKPVFQRSFPWPRAIPQYDNKLLTVKQLVPNLATQQLFICANWYGGVSLSDCISKARTLFAG
ncbi:protoporphyrinogen oxidase [Fibrella sp. HMF5335]|uniref:Coproporphyrinogen III oxidase n=1 Tax=Fibrella rubiginis TaxID=2817060 RepID=A0A939GH28_9BACT|nr:protoporphyrinogen oxidase [Fibrella rubiginis]MBO0936333.1 protoporphyrinogen oxidase [Fibrella rubiginis]